VTFKRRQTPTRLNAQFNAFSEVAGPNPGGFAWGLSFFFGRTIYTAIEGQTHARRRRTLLSRSDDRGLFLDAGDERPDPRDVHLLNRHRVQVRLDQERRQIEIGLEAEIEG